jgi:hypothetical protein
MKKVFMYFVLILFVASCSGGGGSSSGGVGDNTDQYAYDVWEYIVSDTSTTKYFDWYETDENFIPTGDSELNAGQLRETYLSENSVRIEELTGSEEDDNYVLTLNGNVINVSGGNTLNRYGNVGSAMGGDCVLKQHYDNYSPIDGYDFNDVIEIDCGGWSEFYAKGLGKIVGQNVSTWVDDDDNPIATYYSIGVADL